MEALLLSGGIDSIAVAVWRMPSVAITVDYGQVCAAAEIRASRQICTELAIEHLILSVNCSSLGSGDLAGAPHCALAPESEWWPFRNQFLITVAAMKMASLNLNTLLVGTVRSDGFHADGTPAFIDTISNLCRLQEGAIQVEAPAIRYDSVELVRLSGVDLSLLHWAHSCHKSDFACGTCRGCWKNRQVMDELRSAE